MSRSNMALDRLVLSKILMQHLLSSLLGSTRVSILLLPITVRLVLLHSFPVRSLTFHHHVYFFFDVRSFSPVLVAFDTGCKFLRIYKRSPWFSCHC
jgi:hypothetical protein